MNWGVSCVLAVMYESADSNVIPLVFTKKKLLTCFPLVELPWGQGKVAQILNKIYGKAITGCL